MFEVSRFVAPDAVQAAAPTVSVDDFAPGSLDEAQAKQLFARFGVPCAGEIIVRTPTEAEAAARKLGGPTGGAVVLKILSSQITHKSDVGGVALGLTAETVAARLTQMAAEVEAKTGVRPERYLVQERIGGGTELILGMHRDPLGTAILLGMGGVAAELLQDTTLRLLPADSNGPGGLSRAEALSMAMDLKTWPLLDGFRGRPKADVEALVDAIVAFSRMTAQLGERLLEAEINPVFVLPQGQGVRAADGVVVLA
jgi:succinyl-CoA synthetase beta subunit